MGSGHSSEPSEGHARARFGTENEKLGYNVATTRRVTYEEVAQLLEGLVRRFGWTPMMEAGRIIGAELDGQSVTLEPGGQFELSGAPVDTLHKTCAEVNQHLYQARPCQAAVLAGTGGHLTGDYVRRATQHLPRRPAFRRAAFYEPHIVPKEMRATSCERVA
jgi:glutamate--cysteine ligase